MAKKRSTQSNPIAKKKQTTAWHTLNERIVACRSCPRLNAYTQRVAQEKRRAFLDWDYWGLPVPNFGDPGAALLIVGLAPAAHGANRTGRMFTGDRSGDWLFRALAKVGFANQPQATDIEDGLRLHNCAITAACHCAPPDNKPSREEISACEQFLAETIDLLQPRVFLALGQLGWQATVRHLAASNLLLADSSGKIRRPKFAHAANVKLQGNRYLLGSYHPSQQNTFTGRLTEEMLDGVFLEAQRLLHE
ncbi:MAG: uracil-DNA glycosylase [Pirellulales bacterium]|nr:uracil-DNA glycosylase [Pirellulales bacterium]